jgi:haloalkane dehalogenase
MDWARLNQQAVRGICYFETIVRPRAWSELDPIVSDSFRGLRSSQGERLILDENIFIEKILPARILRKLTDEEMGEYRRPFVDAGEGRRPTLSFPREIPIDGEPGGTYAIVSAYAKWMETAQVPKLFINAEPGGILTGALREYCRTWINQREVTVRGSHFLQEDSPAEIGIAIANWIRHLNIGAAL